VKSCRCHSVEAWLQLATHFLEAKAAIDLEHLDALTRLKGRRVDIPFRGLDPEQPLSRSARVVAEHTFELPTVALPYGPSNIDDLVSGTWDIVERHAFCGCCDQASTSSGSFAGVPMIQHAEDRHLSDGFKRSSIGILSVTRVRKEDRPQPNEYRIEAFSPLAVI
jgi:hypothetical protein